MSVRDFLTNRKSTREFKNKDLSIDEIKKIENTLRNVENETDGSICFKIVLDGKSMYNFLDGHAGYSGKMIDSPHYILAIENYVEDNQHNNKNIFNSMYSIEELVTRISEFGIGSCYITVFHLTEDIRKKAFGNSFDKIKYILAIGKPKSSFLNLEKPSSPRLSVEEIVFKDEPNNKIDMQELENYGIKDVLYYSRLAPSEFNTQPWRFLIKDTYIYLITETSKIKKITYASLGVQLYYFEKLAQYASFNSKWEVLDEEAQVGDYTVIARFKL